METTVSVNLAILADDFTGANDTAVQFAKKGFCTGVTLDSTVAETALRRFTVLAVDTETRFDSAQLAFRKTHAAVAQLHAAAVRRFYKKVDSTMRGNPGSEIEAVLDAADLPLAILAPALPSHGRTTLAGQCLVNGVPVSQTEFGRDPRTPVSDSSIAAILAAQCSCPVDILELQTVRRGAEQLFSRLQTLTADGRRHIAVLDAESSTDLELIGRCIALFAQPPLAAGSSGLADYLVVPRTAPSTDHQHGESPAGSVPRGSARRGPALIVVGSVSQTAAAQIEHAVSARSDLCELRLDPAAAVHNPQRERNRLRQLYLLTRSRGVPAILRSTHPADSGRLSPEQIARCIGRLIGDIVVHHPPGGLMLSGGDTAIKTAAALGCSGFAIDGEVLPGIPCGRFIVEPGTRPYAAGVQHIPVVTKAGGFGHRDAIVRILHYLEECTS
ncbi:MAG: four-carbon acid sugar kinase family protein [Spirochaetaceae bacterium]|nr:MAG: four-carbon acid sugar kinase family protein [Spirochaetaceae bacterium]